ncbi:unnamed protein product [Paramecium sonneborni]|uniref:EF-hand domain-containing protein n=1 Tax=Paramecium sonneborni TaxID=65129 RepID=A0A8S1RUU4_9CILI|nr:unnamed protein product [Paramecium sonneborni]
MALWCNFIHFTLWHSSFQWCEDEEILDSVREGQLTFDGEEWNQISYGKEILRSSINIYGQLNGYQLRKIIINLIILSLRFKWRWQDELILGYAKVMSYTDAELEVIKLMKQIDQDKNGSIDYSGFYKIIYQLEVVLATFNKVKLLEDKRLEQAFRLFDKDGSDQYLQMKSKEFQVQMKQLLVMKYGNSCQQKLMPMEMDLQVFKNSKKLLLKLSMLVIQIKNQQKDFILYIKWITYSLLQQHI